MTACNENPRPFLSEDNVSILTIASYLKIFWANMVR